MSNTVKHESGAAEKKLECAKCGHPNSAGKNHCVSCGARMYICCHHCGHSNERIAQHCRECGQRLHRSFWRRIQKRVFGTRNKVTPLQIILLVVFVFIAYKVIVYLAEYQPPTYEGQ